MIHDLLALLGPAHSLPPLLAIVAFVLFLVCFPIPQDFEHDVQCPQVDHLQSTEKIEYHLIFLISNYFCFELCQNF